MYAVKGNRQYTITQADAGSYRAMGFDIVDEAGKVVAHGTGKTVPFAQYQAALDRIETLEKQLEAQGELGQMTVEELRKLAEEEGLQPDAGARKPELIAAILAAREAGHVSDGGTV